MIILLLAGWFVKRGLSAAVANVLAPAVIYSLIAAAAYFGWNAFIANPYREEGRVEIRALWDAAVKKERDRVAEAVAEAMINANIKIAALEKREGELNEELIALALAAANDTESGNDGLSADVVRALNKIR